MPLEELKQATLAKVQEMVTDQSDGSPRYFFSAGSYENIKSRVKLNSEFIYREDNMKFAEHSFYKKLQ